MATSKTSRSQYDTPTKNQVIGARLSGAKISEIAQMFGMPWSSVNDIWKRYLRSGTTYNALRCGRPLKASPRMCRRIVRTVKKDRRLPLPEVAKLLSPKLSARTIRRALAREGIHRRKARRAPYLTEEHRKMRMGWAQAFRLWNMDQFKHIIFSDECYIHIGGSPGAVYVSRTPEEADLQECYAPRFQQSPVKIMVWACVMFGCKGPIAVLDYPGGKGGGMNSERYQEQVLAGKLLDFYCEKSLELGEVYFQQDNARCHASKSTKKWLERNAIMVFPHPPSSPDVNPMENLWAELKRRIRSRPRLPTSVEELKRAVLEAWDSLTVEDINKFVGSMPNRVQAVLAAKGGNTHY